ncbi:MAG TPA: hypothetical protein VF188_01065 [Longimicrobiales bacterium]
MEPSDDVAGALAAPGAVPARAFRLATVGLALGLPGALALTRLVGAPRALAGTWDAPESVATGSVGGACDESAGRE